MPQMSQEEQAFVVETFFARKSYIAVQAEFQQRFNQAPTCKKKIQQNAKKSHSHGTSLNRNKKKFWKTKDCSF